MTERKKAPGRSTRPARKEKAKMNEVEEETKKASPTLFVRLTPELLKRLDKAVERAKTRTPGPRWTRSDLARMFIEEGLARDEDERGR